MTDGEEVMEEARAANISLLCPVAASASLPQPASARTAPSVAVMSSAAATVLGDDEGTDFEELDVDTPAPRLSREKTPTNENTWGLTHPFQRRNSSLVDDKVEEMVRESRQRLMSETSSGASPQHSRALIVYSPLPLPGSADNDEDRGGSDSSPTPRVHANGFQHAGSETSESGSTVTACKSGNGGAREQNVTAGGVLHSADRGAGTASIVNDTEAMSVDEDGAEGVPVDEDTPEPPTLTRMGTSRGRPTPYLTPEWAARARVRRGPTLTRAHKTAMSLCRIRYYAPPPPPPLKFTFLWISRARSVCSPLEDDHSSAVSTRISSMSVLFVWSTTCGNRSNKRASRF